jgi:hypothetical protein
MAMTKGDAKTAQTVKIPIKPLSLHHRVAPNDVSIGLNTLVFH